MPSRSTISAEQSAANLLVERLCIRLSRLSYLALALLVERVLWQLGYQNVRLLGRRYLRGRRQHGGADLSACAQVPLGRGDILVQIKHRSSVVPRQVVDEMRGVLLRRSVPEGLIVTTSSFSKRAILAALRFPGKTIRVMDGERLASILVDAGIGIASTKNLLTGERSFIVDEHAFLELERMASEMQTIS